MKLILGIVIGLLLAGGIALAAYNTGSQNTQQIQRIMPAKMDTDMKHMGHDDHAAAIKDDKTFLEGMIPHHEEAVTSSQELLNVATTSQVRTLAQAIITAQEKEIADMKAWYKKWYGIDYKDNGSYKPMMTSVKGLSAKDAEAAYLRDMMMHHQAAIAMAQKVVPIAVHPELKTLGEDIIKTQKAEITTMQGLLGKNMMPSGHMQ